MSVYDYIDAQKLGKKEYKAAIGVGESPYLPVLDEILDHTEIEKEVDLGLVNIPLNRIVGTKTRGRTRAFARNFMPLLEYGTEFGAKWASLSDAQVEEGIRDPIKVYEYLNRFYVEEGNKRVSVMKYFDAVSIVGNVIRKVPKKNDDPQVCIYYEFMDFYEKTGINTLYVSQEGFFTKLLELTGGTEEVWSEDKRKDFNSAFLRFRSAFQAKGGKKLQIKSGDAVLSFITFYGYENMLSMTSAEMEAAIGKIWNEFVMLREGQTLDIVLDPKVEKEKKEKRILHYLLPVREKKYKVSFVYDKAPEGSDWIYSHELGRLHLDEQFKSELETEVIITEKDAPTAEAALQKAIAGGSDIIFTVTPQLLDPCLKVAVEHHDVKILNCSLNTPHRYVRTYYGRMYEAKFLTGMVAGVMAQNGHIGYIAEYPIYGAIANINAFALGARLVNPRAKIYLQWSTVKDADVTTMFDQENIEFLSGQDFITPDSATREFGLYRRTDKGPVNMAMPVWHWGVFYERLIQSILSGSWKRDGQESGKAYNYWWGISAGVIDVICSNNVPAETRRLVNFLRDEIGKGRFHPFECELKDQQGVIRNKENHILSPEEIIKMDWLLENVVGVIPSIEDLREEAKPVVEMIGVAGTEEVE